MAGVSAADRPDAPQLGPAAPPAEAKALRLVHAANCLVDWAAVPTMSNMKNESERGTPRRLPLIPGTTRLPTKQPLDFWELIWRRTRPKASGVVRRTPFEREHWAVVGPASIFKSARRHVSEPEAATITERPGLLCRTGRFLVLPGVFKRRTRHHSRRLVCLPPPETGTVLFGPADMN